VIHKNYSWYSYATSILLIPFYILRHLSIPYHYLRFKNYIKPNYKVSSEVNFGSSEATNFFLNQLQSANCYLEYGSGNSTVLAQQWGKKIYSVESDKNFFTFLKPRIQQHYLLVSLGVVFFFSTPVFASIRRFYLQKRAIRYASSIIKIMKEAGNLPDLVLVDGRYRVLCCLFVYQLFRSNPHRQISIILDDFVNRRYYEILHSLFDITIIGRVGYLKFKPTDININQLIHHYQYDPR